MDKRFALLVALALGCAAGAASAQTTFRTLCTSTGPGVAEPLGEGRSLTVAAATCITSGGPLDGAATTQNTIWDSSDAVMKLLSGDGVARKPGAVAVYSMTRGIVRNILLEGKRAGWVGEGAGVYTLANGAASSLQGRAFTWKGNWTGPRTYELELRLD